MLQNKPPFIIWLFSFLFLTHMIIYTFFFFFNYRLLCCVWVCQTTHFSSYFDKPDILQLLHILFQLHFQIKRILKALRLQMASWWGVNSSFGLKPFWGSLFSGCSLQSPLMPSPGPHSHLAVSLILTSVPLWSSGREALEHQHPSLPPSHPRCLEESRVSASRTLSPHIIQVAYGRAQLKEHKSVEWQLRPPLIPNKFCAAPQTWEALDNWWCSQHLANHLCLIGYPEIFTLCLMVTEEIDHPILGIYPKRVYKILWSC